MILQTPQASMSQRSRQPINLPDGCWQLILSKLTFLERVRCERVSRQLRGLLAGPDLWPRFDLSLEHLVGNTNNDWWHDPRTPAAK